MNSEPDGTGPAVRAPRGGWLAIFQPVPVTLTDSDKLAVAARPGNETMLPII